MTFQFDTLLRMARFIRAFDPTIKLVAGGYHASLMARELTADGEELPLDIFWSGLKGKPPFENWLLNWRNQPPI